MMSPEAEVLVHCASQRMDGSSIERVGTLCRSGKFRWGHLFGTAQTQEIGALVLTNLLRIPAAAERLPPGLSRRWQQCKIRNILAKKNQARMLRIIAEFFGRRSVRVMLVKGAALDAAVYDEPWYTQSADADVLADVPYRELSVGDRREVDGLVAARHIELDFTRHHDVDMNRVLDIDYARLWREARALTTWPGYAFVMSPEDMLLSACINLCRKRYRQLKGMMAISELIRKFEPLDWGKLARNARRCGTSRIVYTSLIMTRRVLGRSVAAEALDLLDVGKSRRWSIDGLSRCLTASLFHGQHQPRAATRELVTSGLLRVVSYHFSHFWREARAHKRLRQFRAACAGR